MSGGSPGTTQVNQGAGTRDPGFGAAHDFYNSLLGISQSPYPNQYPGQLDPGMSPTMLNAIRMGQGYASSGPPSIMGAAQGSLGQFMSPNFQNPFARIFGGGGGAPNYFPGNNSPMFNNSNQGSMGFLGSNPFMSLGGKQPYGPYAGYPGSNTPFDPNQAYQSGAGQQPPWMSQDPYNVPGSTPGQPQAGGGAGAAGFDPTQVQSILAAMMKMQGGVGAPAQPGDAAGAPGGAGLNPGDQMLNGPAPGGDQMLNGPPPPPGAGTQFPLNPGAAGAGVSGAAPPSPSPLPPATGGAGTPWQPGGGVSATRPNRRPRPLPTWAPKPLPPPAPVQAKPPAPGGLNSGGGWPTGGTPPQGPLPPYTGVDPGTGWYPTGGR